jgi:hypothetical protein
MINIQCQSLSVLHDTVSPHFAQILKLKTRWSLWNFRSAHCMFSRAIHSAFICWPFRGLYWNVRRVFVTCWMHKKRTCCPTFGPHYLGFLCHMSAARSFRSIWPPLSPLAHITHKTLHVTWTVRNPLSSDIFFYEIQFSSAGTFRSRRCALCPCGFQSFCERTLYWRSVTLTSRRRKQTALRYLEVQYWIFPTQISN